jgi:putative membrane protein
MGVRLKADLVAPAFAGLTIALNICWPLTHGVERQWITIAGVVSFFLSSVLSCARTQTPAFTLRLLALMPLTFIVEAIGVHTNFPFGTYTYSNQLGPMWLGVPLLIPMAWIMMLYPSYLASRALSKTPLARIAIGAWLMATWDLYLDPQMVHEGYWTWFTETGQITTNIPLSNFFGWFATSALFMWLLHTNISSQPRVVSENSPMRPLSAPSVMLLWVWIGSFVANIMPFKPYLDRPVVALTGFIGMGLVLAPWSWRLWSHRS